MSKTKEKKLLLYGRRGIVVVSVLAVLILLVNIITLSYSWFEPETVDGKGLKLNDATRLRSEDCSFETFIGEVNDTFSDGHYIDQVLFEDDPLQDQLVANASQTKVTVPAKNGDTPGIVYFRTEIQNNSELYPSVVSLYAHSMPANLTVACTSPSNTVRMVGSTSKSDYYIVRNAFIKTKDLNDADGPGLLPVEWFLQNDTNSAIEIQITATYHMSGDTKIIDTPGLYLMYN